MRSASPLPNGPYSTHEARLSGALAAVHSVLKSDVEAPMRLPRGVSGTPRHIPSSSGFRELPVAFGLGFAVELRVDALVDAVEEPVVELDEEVAGAPRGSMEVDDGDALAWSAPNEVAKPVDDSPGAARDPSSEGVLPRSNTHVPSAATTARIAAMRKGRFDLGGSVFSIRRVIASLDTGIVVVPADGTGALGPLTRVAASDGRCRMADPLPVRPCGSPIEKGCVSPFGAPSASATSGRMGNVCPGCGSGRGRVEEMG